MLAAAFKDNDRITLTSIHAPTKESNLGASGLVLSSNETVALIYTLCCVDWKYLGYG